MFHLILVVNGILGRGLDPNVLVVVVVVVVVVAVVAQQKLQTSSSY